MAEETLAFSLSRKRVEHERYLFGGWNVVTTLGSQSESGVSENQAPSCEIRLKPQT